MCIDYAFRPRLSSRLTLSGRRSEERRVVGRSDTVRSRGRNTSENAGMSSENYVRIIMVENPRFLEEGSSAQGKPGAKARPKGVVDAHTVEIP